MFCTMRTCSASSRKYTFTIQNNSQEKQLLFKRIQIVFLTSVKSLNSRRKESFTSHSYSSNQIVENACRHELGRIVSFGIYKYSIKNVKPFSSTTYGRSRTIDDA